MITLKIKTVMNIVSVLFLSVIYVPIQVQAAEQQPAETLLQQLVRVDKELNTAFKEALSRMDEKGKQALRKEQNAWIKERDNKCDSAFKSKDMEDWLRNAAQDVNRARCIVDSSEARIEQLKPKYQFEDSAYNYGAGNRQICKDFMANLMALVEPPMVCDRKFNPKFKQFTWPTWTKLDAWENRDLIFQIWEERFSYGRGEGNYDDNTPYAKASQFALEYRERYLNQNVDSGDITLSVTRVQIDGKSTTVLQFMEAKKRIPCTDEGCFPCMANGFPSNTPFVRQHYIVDLSNRIIDFTATEDSVLSGLHGSTNDGYYKAPDDTALSRFQGDANEHYADIFLYQGLPYAAFWHGNSKRGTLVIGSASEGDYCIIEFNAKRQKGEKNDFTAHTKHK